MTFKSHSRSSNVLPIESSLLVYELLLVVCSIFRRITHRFRDTSYFNAENHIFPTQLVFDLEFELKVMPFECGDEIWRQKTRIKGLPHSEKNMIVGRTV